MPFLNQLQKWALERPDSPAVIIGPIGMTWSELVAAAEAVVPENSSLTVLEGNNALDFVVRFAAAVAGERQCVVLDPTWPREITAEIIHRLPPADPVDGCDLADGDPTSRFLISLTSGTTSFPKAVSRSRRSWQQSFEASRGFFGPVADDRTLAPGSLAAGLNLFALAECLYTGSVFQTVEAFDVAQVHEALTHDGVTRLILVPAMLRLLSEWGMVGGIDASGIRTIICAGSKLDARTLQATRRWAPNADIFQYYGAAELSFVSAKLLIPGDSEGDGSAIGRPLPGVSVRICGDDATPLPDGQIGSISVRSELTSDGYLWGGDGTVAMSAGAWSTVGDDGFLADGELHLLGRRSDVINSSGTRIYPHEVELALASVPGVEAAVVVGTPGVGYNQRVMAGIVPSAGDVSATFLASEMERLLVPEKLPCQYFRLQGLPITDRGKISRSIFAEWIQGQDARARPLSSSLSIQEISPL